VLMQRVYLVSLTSNRSLTVLGKNQLLVSHLAALAHALHYRKVRLAFKARLV
jgi:hypothetical protein